MLGRYISIVDTSHARYFFVIMSISSLALLVSYCCYFIYTRNVIHVKAYVGVQTIAPIFYVLLRFFSEDFEAVFEITVEVEHSWLPVVS